LPGEAWRAWQAAVTEARAATVVPRRKSPNTFFSDVMPHDDDFLDKAVEGLVQIRTSPLPARQLVGRVS
jgi:hypothetical protein